MVTSLAARIASLSAAGALLAAAAGLLVACVPADRRLAERLECDGGQCQCMPGFGNCDGNPDNGCETVVTDHPFNCGACGWVCNNGVCLDGVCKPLSGNPDVADCNGDPSDGFEADRGVDPRNCGECGHDCLGGGCAEGRCQPFEIMDPGYWYGGLSPAGDTLYFCEYYVGAIMRTNITGGAPGELVVSDALCGDLFAPLPPKAVAVHDNIVVWSAFNIYDGVFNLWAIDLNSQAYRLVASSFDGFVDYVVTGGEISYATVQVSYDGIGELIAFDVQLYTVNTQTWTQALRDAVSCDNAQNCFLGPMAYDDSKLYWVRSSSPNGQRIDEVVEAPVGTTSSGETKWTTPQLIVDLDANHNYFAWVEVDDLETGNYQIYTSLGGLLLHETPAGVDYVVADADHVYWTQKDQTFENRLLRAPLAGDGAAELMAEGQNIHYPFTLDDRVIWVDLPARMFALAK